MGQTIIPNCSATIAFQISEKNFSLHGAYIPPFGALRKGNTDGKPMKKSKAGFVSVQITSETLTRVIINKIFYSNTRPDGNICGQPVIDVLGQRIKGDWENKTKNEKQSAEFLKDELALSSMAKYPDGWSTFGGWTALKREATGFFRTEKINGKWWLIDPEGYVFFSNGVCYSARAGIFGYTEEYRSLHEYLPDEGGEYADAWSNAATQREEISDYIIKILGHGVTVHTVLGEYTKEEKTMIHTVCKRGEAIKLRNRIKEIDPYAFTIITTSSEIIGRGFRGI